MKEKYYDDFLKSLPIAGETGTLRRMFKTSNNYGQIFAKTGTLNGVKCLQVTLKLETEDSFFFLVNERLFRLCRPNKSQNGTIARTCDRFVKKIRRFFTFFRILKE